ncbi:MAG: phosphatidylglycerophosphatase [Pyrinomonadaceae bacterium]|jgi:phosphatidylglycerophosphatase A|nr:phosphatidylglycerophosphatase [Pyrinomonadaceae bacterium]
MKVVKESSDELNPTVVTTAFIGRAPRERGFKDYVALAVATCGVGLIPLAPGTWGSLVGVGVYVLFNGLANSMLMRDPVWLVDMSRGDVVQNLASGVIRASLVRTSALLVIAAAVTYLGIWAATQTEKITGRKDPGIVVVDEVAGQLITFIFLPWDSPAWLLVVGFVLFRVFDIWKPYPIRRLESLEAGLGIMADDVLAGVYAATVLSLLTSIYLLF